MTRDCTHRLVPETDPCPQCLWDSARFGRHLTRPELQARMLAVIEACARAVGSEPGWAEAAAKGPYYALRFTRNVVESPAHSRG